MNYRDYNDYELLSAISDNEEGIELIYKKYKPLIEKNAKRFFKYSRYNGLEINDLIQEGYIGLNNAIKTFNDSKETSFFTYAKTLIERKQISSLIGSSRLKHKFLNESIPLDLTVGQDENIDLKDLIGDNKSNPESLLTDMEEISTLIEKIDDQLTDFERQVFHLKISGFTYNEIAEILEKETKQIDNAIQRIKSKIKNLNC